MLNTCVKNVHHVTAEVWLLGCFLQFLCSGFFWRAWNQWLSDAEEPYLAKHYKTIIVVEMNCGNEPDFFFSVQFFWKFESASVARHIWVYAKD